MTTQQATLSAALALFDAAHRRLQAACRETSEARVLYRSKPMDSWTDTEKWTWMERHQHRYEAAVLGEARAEAAFERARERLDNARQVADGLADGIKEARH